MWTDKGTMGEAAIREYWKSREEGIRELELQGMWGSRGKYGTYMELRNSERTNKGRMGERSR